MHQINCVHMNDQHPALLISIYLAKSLTLELVRGGYNLGLNLTVLIRPKKSSTKRYMC